MMPTMGGASRNDGRAMRVLVIAALALVAAWVPVHAAPISPGCLPNPLPAPPEAGVLLLDTATNFGESLHVQMWRQACQDGTGTAMLMRVSPVTAVPLLCSGDFTLLQSGLQHNPVLRPAAGAARARRERA